MQIESTSNINFLDRVRVYLALMKPGIIFGNLFTASGGFFLASQMSIKFSVFFFLLFGLGLVVGSGCVLNNFIDRNADKKMTRTKDRPLAKGEVSPINALIFALFTGIIGICALVAYVNVLSAMIALVGFVIYVTFYSFLKYKTVHATLIGSIAGAVPPLIGYTAVMNRLDLLGILLFSMIAIWQMPHFYAIAIYRIQEYKKAKVPVLPLARGLHITKVHMLLYILLFMGVCFSLTLLGYTGKLFFLGAFFLGAIWIKLSIEGFYCERDGIWARKMFVYSLVTVMALCILLPFKEF